MIVSGTGHRPEKLFKHDPPQINAYEIENLKRLVSFARKQLQRLQPDEVMSGMALGWDQALALAAIGLKIPLIAAVPCYKQDSGWSPTYQKIYNDLLERSKEVVYVHQGTYTKTCMHERNIYMVDNSDLVLALWNGSTGGTMHCSNYAKRQGTPFENVWDEWFQLATERDWL